MVWRRGDPNDPDDLTSKVYRFSIDRVGETIVGLTHEGAVDISCPVPDTDICETWPDLCDLSQGFIATITSMIENPADGTLYAAGFTAPRFKENSSLASVPVFITPLMAVIPLDATGPIEATTITGCDLALPLAMAWTGSILPDECGGADIDDSGDVDLSDFAIFASQWLRADCESPSWCEGADLNPDIIDRGQVDISDLVILTQHWLETGCN